MCSISENSKIMPANCSQVAPAESIDSYMSSNCQRSVPEACWSSTLVEGCRKILVSFFSCRANLSIFRLNITKYELRSTNYEVIPKFVIHNSRFVIRIQFLILSLVLLMGQWGKPPSLCLPLRELYQKVAL